MVNPDIHADSLNKLQQAVPTSERTSEQEGISIIDSGLSSIEKSKNVKPETSSVNIPLLTAPSDEQCMAFLVASLDATGKPVSDKILSFVVEGDNIKTNMLRGWLKNLQQISELVKQILTSPVYQIAQDIREKGDPKLGVVSGIEGAGAANAAAQRIESVGLLNALENLRVIERVPPTTEVVGSSSSQHVTDSSSPQNSAKALILPLTAALVIGAGLAVGTAAAVNSTTNPLRGVFEAVQHIQPIFPQLEIPNLVSLINLMAVGPLYINSWNEAISNFKNHERHSYVQTAQNFAKDVIKIVTDLSVIQSMIKKMPGTEKLSPDDQDRLGRMLKVVLIGVALSLLYSVEVGKVQNGKFGGIEPEELRDLLTGKLAPLSDPTKKTTEQELLTTSLIKRAWEQLAPFSVEDRTLAVEMLLTYVTKNRVLEHMLEPAKVFDETFAASIFKPHEKLHSFKA